MDKIIDNRKSKLRKFILKISGTTLIILFSVYACFSGNISIRNIERDSIKINAVRNDVFSDYISVIATVEPVQTIYIDATEGGRVEEIYIDEGVKVKANEKILRLSNDNLLLEISNHEANVARAVNEIKNMSVNLENQRVENESKLVGMYYDLLHLERQYGYNKELFEKNQVSKEDLYISKENWQRIQKQYELLKEKVRFDSVFMKTRIDAGDEEVESMQRNLKLVQKRLDKLIIKSPADGELSSLFPRVGEVIKYGTRVGSINILDSYKLKVSVDEHYISRITHGLKASCSILDTLYPAVVKKIYPEVQDGKFSVELNFTEKTPAGIRIGQTSKVRIELGESGKSLLLAKGEFYQSTRGQWVYVLDESGKKAEKREVRLGRQNPLYYEILEGLNANEKVITSGYGDFENVETLLIK